LAFTLLFDEKIRQSGALFWFGLRDAGILYLHAVVQRTIDVSPEFLEHGSVEKIAACRYANRGPNKQEDWRHFCISGSKLQKSMAVDVLFKAYPMVPLLCRSNLAGRYL
jgi:hypothetical protein